jgi:hypothetical protein
MKKILLMAGAALLLAAPVDVAFAQGWRGGDYYGRTYNSGRDYYTGYYRFLRECQRHNRLHGELNGLHAEGHDEGFDSPYDHGDQHDALDQAHDQYHADHPVSDFCDSYGARPYNGGYGYNRPYGNGQYGGYGMSNRFGYAPYRR